MSAQYSEGGSSSSAGDYAPLDGYYAALRTPRTSELNYIPTADELPYLNLARRESKRWPGYVASDYSTLSRRGQFTALPQRDGGYSAPPNASVGLSLWKAPGYQGPYRAPQLRSFRGPPCGPPPPQSCKGGRESYKEAVDYMRE